MPSAPLTVLLVDDEYSIVDAITEVLVFEGHRVLTAGDGIQALQLLRADRPDAIFVDLMMPRMDGVAFIRALWADAELAHLPVVLLTATPGSVPAEMSSRVAIVRKPFDLVTLLTALDRAVGAPDQPL